MNDGLFNPAPEDHPQNSQRLFEYDQKGRLVRCVLEDGSTILYEWDEDADV